jgi:hypothetical protein
MFFGRKERPSSGLILRAIRDILWPKMRERQAGFLWNNHSRPALLFALPLEVPCVEEGS